MNQTSFDRRLCIILAQWGRLCSDAGRSPEQGMGGKLMEAHVEMERDLRAHLEAWEPAEVVEGE